MGSKPKPGKLYCKHCVLTTPKGRISKRPFTYTITEQMLEKLSAGAIHELGCCPNCGKQMQYVKVKTKKKGVNDGKKKFHRSKATHKSKKVV